MTKYDPPKNSFEAVQQAILPKTGIPINSLSEDIVQSVIYDAYKNGAVQEPIYGRHAILASESLARPKDKMHGDYSIGEISEEFYRRGHAELFDNLTCSIGIDYAKQFPATLNIAVESALSPSFWEKIDKHVDGAPPSNFIFEILEHDVDVNADITHLYALKERGYRFALDDFSGDYKDEHRLAVFSDLVDYIKIDGPLVRAALDAPDSAMAQKFHEIVENLQSNYPNAQLIAERVRTADEANTLFDMGFSGVQGRDLKPEDFPYTPEALALEKTASACDYE
tara:strand:- start:222 stop:1067 length:846 start_codon:yes stop_codon:yes gene_type:complete